MKMRAIIFDDDVIKFIEKEFGPLDKINLSQIVNSCFKVRYKI